jgi:hypothetical protein
MKEGKIIGIIGTRRRDSTEAGKKIRGKFFEVYNHGDWICSGGCMKGGDRFAEALAKSEGLPILIYYPDYNQHGRAAPFVRNTSIAEKSDVIIACVMHPNDGIDEVLARKNGGTEDTLKKFFKRTGDKTKIYLV